MSGGKSLTEEMSVSSRLQCYDYDLKTVVIAVLMMSWVSLLQCLHLLLPSTQHMFTGAEVFRLLSLENTIMMLMERKRRSFKVVLHKWLLPGGLLSGR